METIVYSGTLDALTSLCNSDKDAGNYHPFRRESLITPEGRLIDSVPIVSGSTIRGSLRRRAAELFHQELVGHTGTLPLDSVHALRTGGTLREVRKSTVQLTGETQAKLRELVPFFGLFGVTGGGRIMSGATQVDKGVPVAEETAYLFDYYDVDLTGYHLNSVRRLVQQEGYTRIADAFSAAGAPYVTRSESDATEPAKGSGNMIYTRETLTAGTRLLHKVVLTAGTEVEVSFFDDLLRAWGDHAVIGGQAAKGMGQVKGNYRRTSYDLAGGTLTSAPNTALWREHVAAHTEEIKDALTWL